MAQNQVDLVRRFNRVVTQRIGALDDAYLSRGRSLGLSRLLWEIEPAGSEVRLLRARLGLDSAITLPMTEDTARIPRICPSAALPGTGFSAGGVVSGLEASGDPASEVALRKFEKRVDTSGIDQSAVELLRITDMHKQFCHGCDALGFLLLPEESGAPHF